MLRGWESPTIMLVMNRRTLFPTACGLLVCITVALESHGQNIAGASSGRAQFDVIVTASGEHNAPVSPTKSELSVSIDKKPATILAAQPAKAGKLAFVILVDVSLSQKRDGDSIEKAAAQIFEQLAVDGNLGYLGAFNEEVALSRRPLRPDEMSAALGTIKFGGGTALYDALYKTCKQLLDKSVNPEATRRAIILISDGGDNASWNRPEVVEEAAEHGGVAVFSIEKGTDDGRREKLILDELSRKTGGVALRGAPLDDEVALLIAAIQSQVKVEIEVPDLPSGKQHSLTIKSSQKNIRVHAPEFVYFE